MVEKRERLLQRKSRQKPIKSTQHQISDILHTSQKIKAGIKH